MIAGGAGADGRPPSPSPRHIDPCAGLQQVLGKTTAVGLVRHLDVAEPDTNLLVPGEWPVLPLALLHPVLGAVDNGRCRNFLLRERGGGESAGWLSMVRWLTARGGGKGGRRGCGRGCDCEGITDKVCNRLFALYLTAIS